jgi:ParB/RepB/Spo0J family partition protein
MNDVTAAATTAANVVTLDPEVLAAHPDNPRGPITAEDLAELRHSIEKHGQKQPCLVRPRMDHYQIILGHRRAEACRALGRGVRCIVEVLDDDEALCLMIADNEVRRDPDPLVESQAVATLLERPGWTLQAAADALGKPARWVAQRANLRTLIAEMRELQRTPAHPVARWTVDMLERFAVLSPDAQRAAIPDLTSVYYPDHLSKFLADHLHVLGEARWDLADVTLVPEAGACTSCLKTSLRSPGLFDDDVERSSSKAIARARCRDATCWERKRAAYTLVQVQKARKETPDVIFVRGDRDIGRETLPEGLKAKDVHLPYQVSKATAKEPGAVPAILVTGQDAGKKVFVLPPGKTRLASQHDQGQDDDEDGAGDALAGKRGSKASPEQRLEESKKEIAERRGHVVLDLVQRRLDGDVPAPSNTLIVGLVSAYGLEGPDDMVDPDFFSTRKKAFDRAVAGDFSELWPRLKESISLGLSAGDASASTWRSSRRRRGGGSRIRSGGRRTRRPRRRRRSRRGRRRSRAARGRSRCRSRSATARRRSARSGRGRERERRSPRRSRSRSRCPCGRAASAAARTSSRASRPVTGSRRTFAAPVWGRRWPGPTRPARSRLGLVEGHSIRRGDG